MPSHVFSVTVAEIDGVLRDDSLYFPFFCSEPHVVDVDGDKRVRGMLPSAERKLLEYHQAKGAVYPLIQVPNSPQPNLKDGSRSASLVDATFIVAVTGAIVITCYESRFEGRVHLGALRCSFSTTAILHGIISGLIFFSAIVWLGLQRGSRVNIKLIASPPDGPTDRFLVNSNFIGINMLEFSTFLDSKSRKAISLTLNYP
eukprot:766615-Hanusia_phi.AAC.2